MEWCERRLCVRCLHPCGVPGSWGLNAMRAVAAKAAAKASAKGKGA